MKSTRKILSVTEALNRSTRGPRTDDGVIVDDIFTYGRRSQYAGIVACRDYDTGERFSVKLERGSIGDTQLDIARHAQDHDQLWQIGATSIPQEGPTAEDNSVIALSVTSEGLRYDDGKTPLDILSPIALEGTALILELGAVKYELRNWEKGMAWSRVIAPMFRHLLAFIAGEDLDQETGMPHVHHLACNAMFLQHYFELGLGKDDRAKHGAGLLKGIRAKYQGAMDAFKEKWKQTSKN